ncbi:GcvT family protein [Acrocarpospora catenulata]|uniref:GcvT family protein n=1 Tax=Acrocarpospora catenulata TaxID=2836182 RepID=UPI001BDB45A5|nr:FAD-dependent oxidoreductase [Acrocarpospora catenulata]
MVQLPADARVVVVGGGVAGCSVAFHLARLGWQDVVLVERHDLTEGTTWHSAGFVGQLRSTVTQTRMIMYSAGLYPELRELTGLDPGWHGVGGLRLATTPERHAELLRQAGAAETYGLDMDLLSPSATLDRLPLLDVDDVLASLWLPGDGWLDPAMLGKALAAGARKLGVRVCTGVEVIGFDVSDGRVHGVRLREVASGEEASIRTENVVNAAGAAAGVVGRLAGVHVPIVPIKHQYVVTAPSGVPADTPTVRDPDNIVYFREEDGGILVGGYIRTPEIWDDPSPLAAPRTLFPPDMPKFEESWTSARHRLPSLRSDGRIVKVVHGPEAFTPDGEFLLGETSVRGFWVAAGFCVHGLAAAGGVGKVMAEWIVDGHPEYDMFGMDITRFGAHARSTAWARAKALDSYSKYYDIAYPGEERTAARPLRRSPAWVRHAALNAEFGEKAGWERVNWYPSNGDAGDPEHWRPRGWAGRFWSPAIREECLATRDAAGLFDQTSFAKLEISGFEALQALAGADLDRPIGSVVYTQLLNEQGGIEADVTLTRLSANRFRLITGTAFGGHDAALLRRHNLDIHDVTSAYACYCLWGPKAYDILSTLTDDDLTFPYMQAREISVANIPVLAQRVTFVGEFGWELYCPTDYGLTLWDTLMTAGTPEGMRPAGYRAIDSMRLEKGYRVWGLDITPETTPLAAGLTFAVRPARRATIPPPETTLTCLLLDSRQDICLGGEPVRVNGTPVSRITSGGYGHRTDRSIAYAYLPEGTSQAEIGINGNWISATVTSGPVYDPANERIRAKPWT